jgi:hypothetical protein
MRRTIAACATLVLLIAPLSASAQQRRGGAPAPRQAAPRQAAPAPRMAAPAPQMRAPVPPPQMRAPAPAAPAQRGFNLNNDVRAGQAPARPITPTAPSPRTPASRTAPARTIGTTPRAHVHPPAANQPPRGRVVTNRQYHGGRWGWNHGVAWNPAPAYWGGGFWGPFAFASLGVAFGEIIDDDNNQPLYSYQVEPDSPGADLLANYGLTQEQCGDPNLVVIFGPDQSVICADPNDQVPSGEYDIDTDNFTLEALNS